MSPEIDLQKTQDTPPSSDRAGIAELIMGKNRHGPSKTIEPAFQPDFVTFQNLMKV